jgi:aminotransferase MxcL
MEAYQGEMAARGVLMRRDLNFICGAHTDEQIQHTVDATRESLLAMKSRGLF